MTRDRSPSAACAMAPQRMRRLVRLALPHPLTFLHALKTAAQMRRSWYKALSRSPASNAGALTTCRSSIICGGHGRLGSSTTGSAARAARVPSRESAGATRLLPSDRAAAASASRSSRVCSPRRCSICTRRRRVHRGANGRRRAPVRAPGAARRRGRGHFLHLEAPSEIVHRILDWLVYPFIRLKVQRAWSTPFDATAGTR
jgi:hypothetical protein